MCQSAKRRPFRPPLRIRAFGPRCAGLFFIRTMSRPQRTFADDEIIPSFSGPCVPPLLYDQDGEDEAVGQIEREGCLHTESVMGSDAS